MTILSDAAPAVQSARGLQKAMALVLAHLLDHDLPSVAWDVNDYSPELAGQMRRDTGTDDQRRMAMQAWAEFLGGEVRTHAGKGFTAMVVEAVYRGVAVRVWTHVALAESAVTGS